MTEFAMTDDEFWSIISKTTVRNEDTDVRLDRLRAELRQMPIEKIAEFDGIFRRFAGSAYSWDLWGAAYVIHGGCSDDSFEYFRYWLISRGREAYEAALEDPENLADFDFEPTGPDDVWEFEELAYAPLEVYVEKSGENGLDGDDDAAALTGEPFKDDPAYLKARYPKLWERFGETPLG